MDKRKNKSKKIIKSLFVFLAVAILVLIGATIYFYVTGDGDFFPDREPDVLTCACYYIDPGVTTTCGDTKRAFKFNTSQGTIDECAVTCPLTELSEKNLYSNTPEDEYLTCNIKIVPNTQCNAMEIKTEDGLTVTGKIPPDMPIVVKATFDSEEYSKHQFLINNVPTEPDEIVGTSITKTISDYGDATTLLIAAQATNKRGDIVGSETLCKRLIEITTEARAGVRDLTIDTYSGETRTKIRSVIITAGGLKDDIEHSIAFSFEDQSLTMVEGFEVQPSSGKISITEVELYDSENFTTSNSFAILDNYLGEIDVTAEVFQGELSLGTATAQILLEDFSEDPGEAGKEGEEEDPTEEEEEEDDPNEEVEEEEEEEVPTEEEGTVPASTFSVSKDSSVNCVERVSPENIAQFTINITNNSGTADTIESVKDKLPLGFTYVPESSTLDGNPIADSIFVTATDVGESQEIVWEPQSSWSITAAGSLTIAFEATAGENAISGENLNEVIVTPTEIPEDPSTLRASKQIVVAQDCDDIQIEDTPQTGIFDTTIGKISFGIGMILIGVIFYNTSQGNHLAHMIVNSGPYRDAEMTSYKVFNPKKYFEEKILERRERER